MVNDVADARKQRAILLTCCGASTYSLIQSLAAPSKPTDVAYKDLVEKVTAYYALRLSSLSSVHSSLVSPLQRMCLSYRNFQNFVSMARL